MRKNKQENYLLDIFVSEGGYQYLVGDDAKYPNYQQIEYPERAKVMKEKFGKSWKDGVWGDLYEAMFDDPVGRFDIPEPDFLKQYVNVDGGISKEVYDDYIKAYDDYIKAYFGHRMTRNYFVENIVKNHNLDEIGMKLRNWVIDRIERETERCSEPPEPNLDQAEDDYYNPNFGEPSMFDEPIYGENGERMI